MKLGLAQKIVLIVGAFIIFIFCVSYDPGVHNVGANSTPDQVIFRIIGIVVLGGAIFISVGRKKEK